MSDELFEIIHKDGQPWLRSEMTEYAINADAMIAWCDIEGFAIDEYGDIYLIDSCGSYALAPDDCKIVMHERGTCYNKMREFWGADYDDGVDDFECSVCGEDMSGNEPNYCPGCGRKVVSPWVIIEDDEEEVDDE